MLLLRLVYRPTSSIAGAYQALRVITQWRTFARLHPLPAMVALTLVLTSCTVAVSALDSTSYYDRPMPGALVATIIAFYLATAFVVGLTTPSRWGTFSPALGLVAGVFIWPLSPRGSYGNLTYDSGWVGAVVYTLVPAFIVWLVSTTGWNLAGRRKE